MNSNVETTSIRTSGQPKAKSMSKGKSKLISVLPPLAAFIIFVGGWELLVRLLQIPHYLLPTPTAIVTAAVENAANLTTAVSVTILEAVIGFTLSVIGGVAAAILMASSKWVEKSLYPYAVILQTIPVVAIAPIIVIWFGSGMNSIVIITFLIGFFPMLSNTLIGLNATDKDMLNLMKLYKASKMKVMWRVRVPYALPYITAGLKISCTLAVIGAIVGEYIAGIGGGSGGIGYAITVSAARMETAYLFACGIAASLLGIVFFLLINMFSKWVLGSWHESELNNKD
ncbi:NitT/TauT family transport system permease protein [Sinobaca qinghaiensis]|uniref:NitT/TauT family transport system permease protein n=2 Tax=Sinobaca qinghaiensis TaxID=342944 RepID=A0A419V8A0_9BACL|nr:NitT/TauT family transport system permease protein [Sinobaca qinghaiensis]